MTAHLEHDFAKAETERWIKRMTLLEGRLDKIRELLVDNSCTEEPVAEELPRATLSILREAYRLAPKPYLPMEQWTPEARAAAADFYQVVYAAFPILISRAGGPHDAEPIENVPPPRGTLDRIKNELGKLISLIGDHDRGATPQELIILLESIEKAD